MITSFYAYCSDPARSPNTYQCSSPSLLRSSLLNFSRLLQVHVKQREANSLRVSSPRLRLQQAYPSLVFGLLVRAISVLTLSFFQLALLRATLLLLPLLSVGSHFLRRRLAAVELDQAGLTGIVLVAILLEQFLELASSTTISSVNKRNHDGTYALPGRVMP